MIGASFIMKLDYRNAWKIFYRDRHNHASPNSAQTEAVAAGALDVMLAGDAYYFGQLYHNKLMYVSAWIACIIMAVLKWLFITWI